MSSRFSMTNAPVQQPAVCWISGTSVGPFIDTNVDVSVGKIDRGRIYISKDILREMAQVAGLFDEDEPVSVDLKKKEWYNQGYMDAMKEFSDDAYNRILAGLNLVASSSVGAATVVAPTGAGSTAGAAIPSVEDATAGTPEVNQSVDGVELKGSIFGGRKRSARVPADSSNESDYRL